MSKLGLVASCVLAWLTVGCGSNSGSDPGDDAGDAADAATGGSTYAEVASVATMIYDAVYAGQDVTPHIEAIFEGLGIPVLASDDVAGAQARIAAGLPLVTARLVKRMAAAYAQPSFVGVKGFIEGLAEQKVSLAPPYDQYYDLSLFGSLLQGYVSTGQNQPHVPLDRGLVLPTLVWTLGQERARRATTDGGLDPIWGDGQLDPLQFTLLTSMIFAKPASADGAQTPSVTTSGLSTTASLKSTLKSNPAADFIKSQIKDLFEGEVTGAVQDVVEVPLDKGDAAKVSVCGSLILYGHKVSMTNTPSLLWRAPLTPSTTQAKLTLTFEDDYHDNWAHAVIGDAVTDLTGCSFPRKGPIEGKSIKWSVSDALEDQGSYDVTQQVTDVSGKALANWRTISDTIPKACQTLDNQRDATGATEAVVSGLLPGWSTVETIVTFLNPNTGGQGNANLTVQYYELDADDTCHLE
jgi:hypothetical protein